MASREKPILLPSDHKTSVESLTPVTADLFVATPDVGVLRVGEHFRWVPIISDGKDVLRDPDVELVFPNWKALVQFATRLYSAKEVRDSRHAVLPKEVADGWRFMPAFGLTPEIEVDGRFNTLWDKYLGEKCPVGDSQFCYDQIVIDDLRLVHAADGLRLKLPDQSLINPLQTAKQQMALVLQVLSDYRTFRDSMMELNGDLVSPQWCPFLRIVLEKHFEVIRPRTPVSSIEELERILGPKIADSGAGQDEAQISNASEGESAHTNEPWSVERARRGLNELLAAHGFGPSAPRGESK